MGKSNEKKAKEDGPQNNPSIKHRGQGQLTDSVKSELTKEAHVSTTQ